MIEAIALILLVLTLILSFSKFHLIHWIIIIGLMSLFIFIFRKLSEKVKEKQRKKSEIEKEKKRKKLRKKYNDPKVVEKILRSSFWKGQTKEQLLDSLGAPKNINTKVLKHNTKEFWKYNTVLTVIIENSIVVGWNTTI